MRKEPGDLWTYQECLHLRSVQTVRPAAGATAGFGRSGRLRVACPDCEQVLDIRCWPTEAGSWFLRLRERLAAGRELHFRYDGQHWVAAT
jgi:hypothetical protein